ncbi:hypothetical protein FQN60_015712, partial [Etheostoma spectabile]
MFSGSTDTLVQPPTVRNVRTGLRIYDDMTIISRHKKRGADVWRAPTIVTPGTGGQTGPPLPHPIQLQVEEQARDAGETAIQSRACRTTCWTESANRGATCYGIDPVSEDALHHIPKERKVFLKSLKDESKSREDDIITPQKDPHACAASCYRQTPSINAVETMYANVRGLCHENIRIKKKTAGQVPDFSSKALAFASSARLLKNSSVRSSIWGKGTDEDTRSLIQWRMLNASSFMGKCNAALNRYEIRSAPELVSALRGVRQPLHPGNGDDEDGGEGKRERGSPREREERRHREAVERDEQHFEMRERGERRDRE